MMIFSLDFFALLDLHAKVWRDSGDNGSDWPGDIPQSGVHLLDLTSPGYSKQYQLLP